MSATRDFDDIARAWLDLMPDEAPERVVDTVLEAIETTPQRRPWLGGPWRLTKMTRIAIVAGVATIVVASGAFLLLGRPTTNVGPTVDTAFDLAERLPVGRRARRRAPRDVARQCGRGSRPSVGLRSGLAGRELRRNEHRSGQFRAGPWLREHRDQVGPEQIEVVLNRTGGDCVEGARGLYGARLSDNGSYLTLTTLSDDCPIEVASTRACGFDR